MFILKDVLVQVITRDWTGEEGEVQLSSLGQEYSLQGTERHQVRLG